MCVYVGLRACVLKWNIATGDPETIRQTHDSCSQFLSICWPPYCSSKHCSTSCTACSNTRIFLFFRPIRPAHWSKKYNRLRSWWRGPDLSVPETIRLTATQGLSLFFLQANQTRSQIKVIQAYTIIGEEVQIFLSVSRPHCVPSMICCCRALQFRPVSCYAVSDRKVSPAVSLSWNHKSPCASRLPA